MVILLSALAVMGAAVLLIVGLVGGSVAAVQGAIALAVVSMLLLWAARWIGSTVAPALSEEPAPLPPARSNEITYEPATFDGVIDLAGEPEVDVTDDAVVDDDDDLVLDPAAAFPIADYDHLWSTQIVPLLAELDAAELSMVEARERGGRHRIGVLDAVQDQRQLRRLGDTTHAAPEVDFDDLARRLLADPEPAPVDLAEPEDEADDDEPGPAGPGDEARVRVFLGRRRSPLTIDLR